MINRPHRDFRKICFLFATIVVLALNQVHASGSDEPISSEGMGITPSQEIIALLMEPETPASDVLFSAALSERARAVLAAAHRFRSVRINPQALTDGAIGEGTTLYLPLFDDVRLWATIDRVSAAINGVTTIRGRIEGTTFGSVLLSISAGRILAAIEIPEIQQEYVISDFGLGLGHIVQETDRERKDVLEPGPALVPSLGELDGGQGGVPPHSPGATSEAQVTVDLMVVYTPAARLWAETYATSIHHVISQAIARDQLALDNSQIGMTLNLVNAAEVDYTESGDSRVDLDRLTFHAGYDPWGYEGEPRYLEEVQGLRNRFGADLVTMFARVEDVGGIAWLLSA